MKKHTRRNFCTTLLLFAAFLLWTIAISCFDVQAIGPDGSSVGFAALNAFIHNLTGVHMALYTVTDWLGLVPLCFAAGFALLGLVQLIQRKRICRVDDNILILGGFYILVIAAYSFFEMFVVNYRPVLIDGCLEASYPSSTTLLVLCILPTTMMQLHTRVYRYCRRYSVKRWAGYAVQFPMQFIRLQTVQCRTGTPFLNLRFYK